MVRCEGKKKIFFPFGCVTHVHPLELLKGSASSMHTDQANQRSKWPPECCCLLAFFPSSTFVSESLLPLTLTVMEHGLRNLYGQRPSACNQDCSHFSELKIGLPGESSASVFMATTGKGFEMEAAWGFHVRSLEKRRQKESWSRIWDPADLSSPEYRLPDPRTSLSFSESLFLHL